MTQRLSAPTVKITTVTLGKTKEQVPFCFNCYCCSDASGLRLFIGCMNGRLSARLSAENENGHIFQQPYSFLGGTIARRYLCDFS